MSDFLAQRLHLVSQGRKTPNIDLIRALAGDPALSRTIDGASTLTLPVADYKRELLLNDAIDERCWVHYGGIRFELVSLSKSADLLTLTFEDSVAASLRRVTEKLSIPAGTRSRASIAAKLAAEPRSHVPIDTEPDKRGPVQQATQRSVGEKSNSWDLLAELAEAVQWRRISTGKRLLFGGDDWLMGRFKPVELRENTGGVVSSIDFDLDAGKRASEASLTVDTSLLGLTPGDPILLSRMGPADGKWLLGDVDHPLSSTRATLRLVRGRHELKEPKREKAKGPGDSGDPDNTPGQEAPDSTPHASASNSARERMIQTALAQRGKPYVWGAKGPASFDCSGLVQYCTSAAGKPLYAPSASQAATCAGAGRGISVAEGLRTRGALLFRIGVGSYNHVVFSLGNGTTMEARGSAYGTNVFGGAAGGGWTSAALWV